MASDATLTLALEGELTIVESGRSALLTLRSGFNGSATQAVA